MQQKFNMYKKLEVIFLKFKCTKIWKVETEILSPSFSITRPFGVCVRQKKYEAVQETHRRGGELDVRGGVRLKKTRKENSSQTQRSKRRSWTLANLSQERRGRGGGWGGGTGLWLCGATCCRLPEAVRVCRTFSRSATPLWKAWEGKSLEELWRTESWNSNNPAEESIPTGESDCRVSDCKHRNEWKLALTAPEAANELPDLSDWGSDLLNFWFYYSWPSSLNLYASYNCFESLWAVICHPQAMGVTVVVEIVEIPAGRNYMKDNR